MVLTPSRRCQHLKSSGQVPAEFPCLESIVWPPIAYWKHMISLTWSLTWRCSLKINTLGMCRLPVRVPCGVILALSGGSPHCVVQVVDIPTHWLIWYTSHPPSSHTHTHTHTSPRHQCTPTLRWLSNSRYNWYKDWLWSSVSLLDSMRSRKRKDQRRRETRESECIITLVPRVKIVCGV